MRRALNRERTNVGRTAYSDRVKAILLASKSESVAKSLADDLVLVSQGSNHDEIVWTEVAIHASQVLNASGKAVIVSADELTSARDSVDHAIDQGFQ